jgi:ATP-dependent DNA helicase RecG
MSFIRRNNRTLWYKEPMQRIEIPQYMERCVMEVVVNALAHRDYLIQGSEVHVDMYDDRMVIYSPGSMPEGRLIQTMNLEDIPSVRRNPVIADIFAQLGYMERKGSGMGKIINPIKALPYFEEKMLPTFFSDRAQFTVTFPNMILAWQETHPNIEVNFVENKDDTQGDTQDDTQEKIIKMIEENPRVKKSRN